MAEALAAVHQHGDFYEAELYRLKGEMLQNAECGGRHAALTPEACFQQAIDIARRQQAKSLELRATMSLARLWWWQSKRNEARELLAPVYGWFPEGFDTADLQEAKVLLEELGGEQDRIITGPQNGSNRSFALLGPPWDRAYRPLPRSDGVIRRRRSLPRG